MNAITQYIQIEAVNIYASVYDTSQLSVVRGGSLLLKLAVELLGAATGAPDTRDDWPAYRVLADFNQRIGELNRSDGGTPRNLPTFEPPETNITGALTAITTGASSAIYEVAAGADAAGLAEQLRKYLSGHAYLRHFTFTVVAEPATGDFPADKERLIATSRLQQLRQLSIVPDPEREESAESVPCHQQGLRAATGAMALAPKPFEQRRKEKGIEPWLSAACAARFWFGRYTRHALYRLEVGALVAGESGGAAGSGHGQSKPWWEGTEVDVTESFDQIADTDEFPQLENKIAVFYADGDGFSGLQRDYVGTAQDQRHFDDAMKGQRRAFLQYLVQQWGGHKRKKREAERDRDAPNYRVPLETLLWGGDELVIVVPASKGFELAQAFFSFDWTLTLHGDTGADEGEDQAKKKTLPLSYSGGLVFCHYKTPIRKVRKLAEDLAEGVKEQRAKAERDGRAWQGSHFDYAVLESIDYPAEPLNAFFRKRYGPLAEHRFPLRAPFGGGAGAEKTGGNWAELEPELKRLLVSGPGGKGEPAGGGGREVPKSQAYGIARAALADDCTPEVAGIEAKEQAESGPLRDQDRNIIAPVSRFQGALQRFKQLRRLDVGVAAAPAENTAAAGTENGDPLRFLWDRIIRPPVAAAPKSGLADASDLASPPPALARWQWLHLVELWDYLAPVRDPNFKEDETTEAKS